MDSPANDTEPTPPSRSATDADEPLTARRIILRLCLVLLLIGAGAATRLLPAFLRPSAEWRGEPLDATKPNVRTVLASVQDPELDIDIVALGLVEAVSVGEDGAVGVTLVLTTPACPFRDALTRDVRLALESGIRDGAIRVAVDPSVPWTPRRMSPEARRRLGLDGSKNGPERPR